MRCCGSSWTKGSICSSRPVASWRRACGPARRASRIVFHGNAKTDAELTAAAQARVGLVVADGLDELRRLDRIARAAGTVQPTLLRVVPDVEVETHEAIATGHDASKFGTALATPRGCCGRRPG